jgi:hypothetical protein
MSKAGDVETGEAGEHTCNRIINTLVFCQHIMLLLFSLQLGLPANTSLHCAGYHVGVQKKLHIFQWLLIM